MTHSYGETADGSCRECEKPVGTSSGCESCRPTTTSSAPAWIIPGSLLGDAGRRGLLPPQGLQLPYTREGSRA